MENGTFAIKFMDEMISMEHPIFSLMPKNKKIRKYRNKNMIVQIIPSLYGMATVFDKDVWIYSISKLKEDLKHGSTLNRTVSFVPYHFFRSTCRDSGGRSYRELEKSLSRLHGTKINTNFHFNISRNTTRTEFNLIDSWKIIERKNGNLKSKLIEIVLPIWIHRSILNSGLLQINPKYFKIRKAINRRLYEIARKHCGNQSSFSIRLEKLHLKSGSFSNILSFKRQIKLISIENDLPDYEIFSDRFCSVVTFRKRN
ncbi:hypothetical protein AOQ88_00025 (plasmid) [Candidatus Riesia sp. GBBU]|nr:hypothetical protein AOQ88_00025 [Candidatus Riesia sp. GBBU]